MYGNLIFEKQFSTIVLFPWNGTLFEISNIHPLFYLMT